MSLDYINKKDTEFVIGAFSKIFEKEIFISFQLLDRSIINSGYQITLNPFSSEASSIDKNFEKECDNVKTVLGLKKKAKENFKVSGKQCFNLSQDFITKIDLISIQPIRNDKYWSQNPDMFLKFLDLACQKTKEENYEYDYVELIWILTDSYIDFVYSVPGLEKKIKELLFKNNFLSYPLLGNYDKLWKNNKSFVQNNFDLLVTENLEEFYRLDKENDPIFEDLNWRKYYLSKLLTGFSDSSINIIKHYNINTNFKSALDFLAQSYIEDVPEKRKLFLKNNKIGFDFKVENNLFLENKYNNNYFIKIDIKEFNNTIPLYLSNNSNFFSTFGKIIEKVINNITNHTDAVFFTNNNSMAFDISTSQNYSKDYFIKIIHSCVSEISVCIVESNSDVIVNKISIAVNARLMQDSIAVNKNSNRKGFKL